MFKECSWSGWAWRIALRVRTRRLSRLAGFSSALSWRGTSVIGRPRRYYGYESDHWSSKGRHCCSPSESTKLSRQWVWNMSLYVFMNTLYDNFFFNFRSFKAWHSLVQQKKKCRENNAAFLKTKLQKSWKTWRYKREVLCENSNYH